MFSFSRFGWGEVFVGDEYVYAFIYLILLCFPSYLVDEIDITKLVSVSS